MPKKQRKQKSNSGKIDENLLNELAVSLKIKSEESSDESEKENEESDNDKPNLEGDLRLTRGNFGVDSFNDFMDSRTPVLERIAGRQVGPVFVGGIPSGPQTIPGEDKNSDPFKYMPGNSGNGEPKYIDSDSHLTTQTERVDFSRIGRNNEPWRINQEVSFMQSQEAAFGSSSQEKMFGIERFDESRERRKNPMEREEAKYDKYKPDLPKSR